MAIYNLIGGAISTQIISIHGGYGDSITLTNTRNGNKYKFDLTDTTKKDGVEIKSGTYSIASTYLEKVGITIPDVEIKRGTSFVLAFPPSAIYWFGNGHKEGSYLLSKYGKYKTTGRKVAAGNETKNYTEFGDTYVRSKIYSNATKTKYEALTTNANLISFDGYSTINFFGSHPYRNTLVWVTSNDGSYSYQVGVGNKGYFGISTNKSALAVKDGNKNITNKKVSVKITNSITSGYCGILATSQGEKDNNYCHTDMYACWLE